MRYLMKKIILACFIILSMTFLMSCQNQASLEDVLEDIEIQFASTDSIDAVTTHVKLPTTSSINKNVSLRWETSHPDIIDAYGTVNQPEYDTTVTLTVYVSLYGLTTIDREFNLTVLGYNIDLSVVFMINDEIYKSYDVNKGDYISGFVDPEISGYIFEGWFIAPDLETAFVFTEPITQSLVIEAKLTEIPMGDYKVEVYYQNIEDENYTLYSTESKRAEIGELAELPTEIEGFTINVELSSTPELITDIAQTYSVYFDRNAYHVTFMSEGVEIGNQNLIYGEKVEMPTGLIKENHILNGWTIDETHLVQFDFDRLITSDLILYAKWVQDASDLTAIDYNGFSNYYTQLETSDDIIADLASILRGTIDYISYGDARYVYTKYDNDSQVILYDVPSSVTYRNVPAYGTAGWGTGGVITTTSFTVTINREHIWACNDMQIMPVNADRTLDGYVGYKLNDNSFDDRPSNTDRGHYSDLHNLWNALAGPNGVHSDHFFGEENGSSISSYLANNAFYPGDEYKGDIARALFYMTLMYPYLTLVDKGSPNAFEGYIYYGYLDVLLKWNEEDSVSYYELEKNQTIFNEQGNRNPFIDFYDYDFANLIFTFGDPNILD